MPIEQTSADCPHCGDLILATRAGTNHLVHGLATVFTLGLWLPVWAVAAASPDPYRCSSCGSPVTSVEEQVPPGDIRRGIITFTLFVGALIGGAVLLVGWR